MKSSSNMAVIELHRLVARCLVLMLVVPVLSAAAAQAQDYTYQVLYSFAEPPSFHGQGLAVDGQGNLYSTSVGDGLFGQGTVFKLDMDGNFTVLHNFSGTGGDGADPSSSVIHDAQGNLYGVTVLGGELSCLPPLGCGTVYKLDPAGNETILYAFTGVGGDGAGPRGDLALDAEGNLYGATRAGGTSNNGTIFKLTTSNVETVLYSFAGGSQASLPQGLVRDASGNLFGTTQIGGNSSGTLFELTKEGTFFTLHAFDPRSGDGATPNPRIVLDSQGNIYGTSFLGGHVSRRWPFGAGVVFKVDAQGNEALLYTFCVSGASPCLDGARPVGGPAVDSAGNVYGTTSADGLTRGGTIFKVDPAGNETVLRNFKRRDRNGSSPEVDLTLDPQGNLYGEAGVVRGNGLVFGMLVPSEATTTTLTSTPNPSKSGQTVTFTAVVSPLSGAPPDGGTVTFLNRKLPIGTATVSGGVATFSTSTLLVGTRPITAVYGGTPHLIGSSSNTVKQVVKN